jgi:hypothetical protein
MVVCTKESRYDISTYLDTTITVRYTYMANAQFIFDISWDEAPELGLDIMDQVGRALGNGTGLIYELWQPEGRDIQVKVYLEPVTPRPLRDLANDVESLIEEGVAEAGSEYELPIKVTRYSAQLMNG